MRTIHLDARQARLLRDNLTNNQTGYDYLDLVRLDRLAKQLQDLQSEYGEQMAELTRERQALRRDYAQGNLSEGELNRRILALDFDGQDLNEQAMTVAVDFVVEDSDYKLIRDKLDGIKGWLALDELRPTVIGMVEAIRQAEGTSEPVSMSKRRKR